MHCARCAACTVQCALYKLHSVCNVHVGRIVSHQLEKWSLSTGINSRPQTIKAEPVFLNVLEPRNRFQGLNSASLCSLAGRYDYPTPTRFLAPIDCSKIPAQDSCPPLSLYLPSLTSNAISIVQIICPIVLF